MIPPRISALAIRHSNGDGCRRGVIFLISTSCVVLTFACGGGPGSQTGSRTFCKQKDKAFEFFFLSILKIGPTGPTTGEWIANWSFYLTNWQLEVARHARLTGGFHLVFTPTTKRRR